jgi:hypothetical protein
MTRVAVLLAVGTLAAGNAPPWSAPPNPMQLTRKAGLTPETHEFVFLHVHAHLDVFVKGRKIRVPAGIGINIHDPAVRRFPAQDGTIGYGGISPSCSKPCISPLHTHFDDGVLHTEAKKHEFNRLGQFFTEWNVRLTRKCVATFCKPKRMIAVYVDGEKYTGDPRAIELEDKREIAIVIGRGPSHIPSKFP